MRLMPVVFAAAIAAGTMASAGYGQRADDQIDPRSASLAREAQTALGAGRHADATDLFETALALDPRNREAYLGLARVAQAQRLPGKAIRLYQDALTIEPNDLNALAGQGEAYVQRGAVDRARRNLTKVQELCGRPCPQATQLAAVIQRGPPVATAESSPPAATPTPVPARRPN
ncbi:MAG TPA: tetratricopeptide repeat protein [Allosphingosinicella sp.]